MKHNLVEYFLHVEEKIILNVVLFFKMINNFCSNEAYIKTKFIALLLNLVLVKLRLGVITPFFLAALLLYITFCS